MLRKEIKAEAEKLALADSEEKLRAPCEENAGSNPKTTSRAEVTG